LAATNLRYLVTNSPIKASSPLPDVPDIDISPVKGQTAKAKAKEPRVKTDYKLKLEETLEIERARLLKAKGQAMQLQAAVVLQQVYCGRLWGQLQVKVKKKNKNDGGKLDKNLPFLLTSDAFLEHVRQKEENTEATHKAREQ
ncbi:hypothetical protein H0H81_012759, partial [Sphagnurus paluster]